MMIYLPDPPIPEHCHYYTGGPKGKTIYMVWDNPIEFMVIMKEEVDE